MDAPDYGEGSINEEVRKKMGARNEVGDGSVVVNFKFKIGDIVRHKMFPTSRMFITQRHYAETSGGGIRMYQGLQGKDYSVMIGPNTQVNEIEIEVVPNPTGNEKTVEER